MTTELFVTPVWTWLNVILSNIAFVVIENYNKLVVFLFLQTTPFPQRQTIVSPRPTPNDCSIPATTDYLFCVAEYKVYLAVSTIKV